MFHVFQGVLSGVLCSLLIVLLIAPVPAEADGQRRPANPFAVESGTIEVPRDYTDRSEGTFTLHFEVYRSPDSPPGGKEPLIALHGGPGNPIPIGKILGGTPLGKALLDNYTILYFDQRGAGRSDPGLTLEAIRAKVGRFRMAQYIEDIEALRRSVFGKETKVTLFGSSWGGYLGLGYALRYPDNLDALILGSFEATAASTTDFCRSMDRALEAERKADPELRRLMDRTLRAIEDGRIVWHRGRAEAYVLKPQNLLDLVAQFMFKARYDQAKTILQGILHRDDEAIAFLDGLEDVGSDYTISMGGSRIGEATFCLELVDYALLREKRATPGNCHYCDDKEYAKALLRHCRAYTETSRPFDAGARLRDIDVPTLVFAGKRDPVVPWKATEGTAARMPGTTFLLIEEGAHTPLREGGACLADIIVQFARDPRKLDTACLRER